MREFAGQTNLAVWYRRLDVSGLAELLQGRVGRADRAAFAKNRRKAEGKDSLRALTRLTEVVDGERRFRNIPPLLVPLHELVIQEGHGPEVEEYVRGLVASYDGVPRDRRHCLEGYRVVDIARKVVGVGSVGTRAWVILLLGRDAADPLVLQAKEAGPSVLEPYAGESELEHHGERVVEGQRLMQAASDIFLGWTRVDAPDGVRRDFHVRQLWDGKGSAELETITLRGSRRTPRCADGRSPAHTRARATASRSRRTSARARRSTRRSWSSRTCTPTRTNATSPCCSTRSPRGRSPRRPESELAGSPRSSLR
jgi:hypothetical protein